MKKLRLNKLNQKNKEKNKKKLLEKQKQKLKKIELRMKGYSN